MVAVAGDFVPMMCWLFAIVPVSHASLHVERDQDSVAAGDASGVLCCTGEGSLTLLEGCVAHFAAA